MNTAVMILHSTQNQLTSIKQEYNQKVSARCEQTNKCTKYDATQGPIVFLNELDKFLQKEYVEKALGQVKDLK